MGEVIGSIGEDGRCKLWQEDVTEVALSGNRFKLLYNLAAPCNVKDQNLDNLGICPDDISDIPSILVTLFIAFCIVYAQVYVVFFCEMTAPDIGSIFTKEEKIRWRMCCATFI